MDASVDLLPLFKREFELCNLQEGEVVAVLSEPATRPAYVNTAAAAAQALGAHVYNIVVPGMGWDVPTVIRGMGASVPALAHPSPLLDSVAAALRSSTFIVDLIPETMLHVPVREELLEAGVRILTIVEPPDMLERMFPSEEIADNVRRVRERVTAAKHLRLTSDAGTDLSYEMSGIVPMQYGYADQPGRWDHWPSALVGGYPVDGSSQGTAVLNRGDIVYPFKRYVESPVTFHVDGGYIRKIEGGVDADLIREFLESWDEPEVFATSHIGFGMHPRAWWSSLAFYDKEQTIGMDGRCFRGAFLFTTGPNRYTGRRVEAHLDMPMRGCNVFLDDELLVEEGRLLDVAAIA